MIEKNGFVFFSFIFMGVNPFDSAALGRLIERVVHSGFMKTKYRNINLNQINKNGVHFSLKVFDDLGKRVPPFLLIRHKSCFIYSLLS